MKKLVSLIITLSIITILHSQEPNPTVIKEMNWGLDYNINLILSNDSTYVLNVENLHQTNTQFGDTKLTYYPVNFSEGYVKLLKDKNAKLPLNEETVQIHENLWRAMSSVITGSWAHFLNCLLYALETGQLELTAQEMTRPETNWKPKPMTETYKRTKKWEYYIPVNQKSALKEYKRKNKNHQLADLEGIPSQFLDLFLKTSEKEYQAYKLSGQMDKVAKIDLVKLLLGSNYLGEKQIKYIKNKVLETTLEYSIYQLPSVIIFNNFNAAVAMSLTGDGYKIEGIAFSITEDIHEEEKAKRSVEIRKIIEDINEVNQKAIEKKLKKLYN